MPDARADGAEPNGVVPVPAPRASHAGSLVATGLLLALWLGVTVGAPLLVGPVRAAAVAVEVGLGLDVLPGPDTGRADDEEGG
jgi:hypothetical protein